MRRAATGRGASARDLDRFEATQRELVGAGIVDADIEVLPRPDEYDARRRAGAGLTVPSWPCCSPGAKRSVKAAVLASDLPDEPAIHELLVAYFPQALAERFGDVLDRHRLRRELIASELTNEMVDHLGPVFVSRLATETGRPLADVARAYWVARSVADGSALWRETAATLAPAAPGRGGRSCRPR